MDIMITLIIIYLIYTLYKWVDIQIENTNNTIIVFFNDFKLNRKYIIIWK
jgi:hypothetical protein